MSDATHTPGPWVGDDGEGYSQWTIWAGNSPTGQLPAGSLIATVAGDSAEADANAALIARAPDMAAEIARLRAENERLQDQALRYALDQVGIDKRDAEAVELVTLRAENERLRSALRDIKTRADGAISGDGPERAVAPDVIATIANLALAATAPEPSHE